MASRTSPGNSSEKVVDDSNNPLTGKEFVSVTEAAHLAMVSEETVRSWFDSGEITGVRDARGRRVIDTISLRRRLDSMGVVEAARSVDRSPYIVRQWFDGGHIDGYLTATGRRRIYRASIEGYHRGLVERAAEKSS